MISVLELIIIARCRGDCDLCERSDIERWFVRFVNEVKHAKLVLRADTRDIPLAFPWERISKYLGVIILLFLKTINLGLLCMRIASN